MSGSLRWFVYTADGGEKFAVNRDESNMESAHDSPQSWGGAGNSPKYTLPGNLKPRRAKFKSATGKVSYVVMLTEAAMDALTAADEITVNGEARKFAGTIAQTFSQQPFQGDSGETDGDQDSGTGT